MNRQTPTFQIFGVPEDGIAERVALEVLKSQFDGDLVEAKKCQEEEKALLEAGDEDAESRTHRWSKVEEAMYYAIRKECFINESKWSGVSVSW